MSKIRLSLAALLLGASLTPALAESHPSGQAPVEAFVQSLDRPAAAPVLKEGRQATPIATTAPSTSGAERYLDGRIVDGDR